MRNHNIQTIDSLKDFCFKCFYFNELFLINLQATDVDSGTTIFALSGTPSEISAEYQSSGNEVTLTFSSDTDTNLQGWRVEWTRVDPVTTTFATTPACKFGLGSFFNDQWDFPSHTSDIWSLW